jgi:hypothetical protein
VRSASALKRFCAYPEVLDKAPPKTAAEKTRAANRDASAVRGTIFHKAIEDWANSRTGQVSRVEDPEIQGWVDLLASQWKPPLGFQAEVKWGLGPNGEYKDVLEPEPHVYIAADGSELLTAGTADGAWEWSAVETTYIADWKSGKWPVEPARTNLQVNSAGLALAVRNFTRFYRAGIYYPRDGIWDWGETIEVGSEAYRAHLAAVQASARLGTEPRPGPHCSACWSKSKCPKAQVSP